jgi:hypothetical protein
MAIVNLSKSSYYVYIDYVEVDSPCATQWYCVVLLILIGRKMATLWVEGNTLNVKSYRYFIIMLIKSVFFFFLSPCLFLLYFSFLNYRNIFVSSLNNQCAAKLMDIVAEQLSVSVFLFSFPIPILYTWIPDAICVFISHQEFGRRTFLKCRVVLRCKTSLDFIHLTHSCYPGRWNSWKRERVKKSMFSIFFNFGAPFSSLAFLPPFIGSLWL